MIPCCDPTNHFGLSPTNEMHNPHSLPTSNGSSPTTSSLLELRHTQITTFTASHVHQAFVFQLPSPTYKFLLLSLFSIKLTMDSHPPTQFWFDTTKSSYTEIENSALRVTFSIPTDHKIQIPRLPNILI